MKRFIPNIFKWGLLLIVFLLVSPVNAFDFGKFSFSIQPKIPTDEGSLSDYGIGFRYTDKISSEIRLKMTERRTTEKFSGIDSSLNVVVNSETKWSLLPLQYSFFRTEKNTFSAGLGIYHYRQKLEENGYFNLIFLETPVNAYINNFTMNITGPIIEAQFSSAFSDFFTITAAAEIVPFAFINTKQTVDIIPLYFTGAFTHDQSQSGALVFQGKLATGIFDLVDISGIYNGFFHTFDSIDFDDDLHTIVTSKKSLSQSFQIEGSVNIKINPVDVNIGIGGIFNSVYLDSVRATEGRRLYFVFGGKKTFW